MDADDLLEDIRRAQGGVEKANIEAKKIKEGARIELGRAINRARDQGIDQRRIAELLDLTREHVRRLQKTAKAADEEEGGT